MITHLPGFTNFTFTKLLKFNKRKINYYLFSFAVVPAALG
jgi:hypothetical protein